MDDDVWGGGRIDSENILLLRVQINTYLGNSKYTELLTLANPRLEEITQDNL
jgi:hypothetical protein